MTTQELEHVPDPCELIADRHRVLKPGGTGIITLPWSARFHYKPYDYHRYTPSTLATLFAAFSEATIHNRGTDINAIVNKSIVLYFGSIASIGSVSRSFSRLIWLPIRIILFILFGPVIGLLTIWGHLALWFGWGSSDDPLGYTVMLRK